MTVIPAVSWSHSVLKTSSLMLSAGQPISDNCSAVTIVSLIRSRHPDSDVRNCFVSGIVIVSSPPLLL